MKKFISCLMALAAQCAVASDDTMIVFDTSGSMWGQIAGKTKIEIARDAMADISQGFGSDQSIGLMAYGHRRKGDCGDIETLVAPAHGTAEQIVAQVNQLTPKGKTPLSQAVKMAAETMKFTENAATVVLITDGVETCDMDPCAVATELEKLGVNFTAHVIGFGLSVDQGKQVSCVADATGGLYLPAQDAASLNQALEQVVVATPAPGLVVELPEATVDGPDAGVVIGASFATQWTGPQGELDYIDVVKQGEERVYGEITYQWAHKGAPAQLRAPGEVGEYEVRYVWQGPKQKHVLATDTIQVVDSEVSLVAPSEVAAGTYFSVSWQGPGREGDYVDLVPAAYQRTYGELSYFYTKTGSPSQIQAPAEAGAYQLRYVLEAPGGRQVLYQIPLEVRAAEASLALQPTAEVATMVPVYWTGPNNPEGYIDVVKADYQRTYGEIGYFYLKDNPDSGELLMPVEPGDYQVRFVMQGADGRKVITSSPIKVLAVPATLSLPRTATVGSTIEVLWTGPNRDRDYIDMVKVDNNRTYGEITYFYTNKNLEKGSLTMPEVPGNYKVRYVLQGKQRLVLVEQPITVE